MENTLNKRYDIHKTFEYNKEKGPFEKIYDKNKRIRKILWKYGIDADFFWYKTNLPIWVAAGPLYNEKYMKWAAKDGFEVITWKTFRSIHRLAHASDWKYIWHNIVFIPTTQINEKSIWNKVVWSLDYKWKIENISITNSFWMPSDKIPEWLPSIVRLEQYAKEKQKQIITSVVWTPKENWTIHDLALDYAFLARTAEFTWSKIIELNLSCPNVSGAEWSIFKDIENSLIIVTNTRKFLHNSNTKLLVKMWYTYKSYYKDFMDALSPYIDWIVAINTIPMEIIDKKWKQALAWWKNSWTCGKAILDLAVNAVANLKEAKIDLWEKAKHIKIVWCWWVMDAEWFMRHIDAWAEFVMCATAALFNPELPLEIAKYINKNKIKKII